MANQRARGGGAPRARRRQGGEAGVRRWPPLGDVAAGRGGGAGLRPGAARTVAGGEAAAEAEAAGRLPAGPCGAAAHRQHPRPGRRAAARLHEEAEPAPRAGSAAPQRRGAAGRGAGPSPGPAPGPLGTPPGAAGAPPVRAGGASQAPRGP